MIGGDESRCSTKYDTKKDEWTWIAKLPAGHPISCNVCVNYNNQAVFSFTVDGRLNISAAALPLQNMRATQYKEGIEHEMTWALNKPSTEHKIDRFHIKCATVMEDGSIAVVARGRTEGMKMQVSTIILRFDVKFADGKWILTMREKVDIAFPTIFCRQLDHI
jgi:hypothetical protein